MEMTKSKTAQRNYWAPVKTPVATWYVTLPPPRQDKGVEHLLEFAARLLTAGADTEVFAMPATLPYSPATYQSLLRQAWQEQGEMPFFSGRLEPGTGDSLKAFTNICYFDSSGSVQEKAVSDLGELWQRLRHEAGQEVDRNIRVAPVSISGLTRVRAEVNGSTPGEIHLGIALNTDLWFDTVVGFAEDEGEDDDETVTFEGYDNRLLARCHTPRLNRFLQSVRDAAQHCGGAWEVGEIHPFYEKWCSEDGVTIASQADVAR